MTYNTVNDWSIVGVVLLSFAIALNIVVWVVNWRKRRALPTLSEALGVVVLVLGAINQAIIYIIFADGARAWLGIGFVVNAITGVLAFALGVILFVLTLRRRLERQRSSETR